MTPRPNNVAEFLLSEKTPAREAILTLQRSYTYGELISATCRVAHHLLERGGKKGDRVLLVAENSFFWVAAYLGILRAGLVCVPLPATSTTENLLYVSETTQSRYGFVQAVVIAKHPQLMPDESLVTDSRLGDRKGIPALDNLTEWKTAATLPLATNESDLAALMFTSGSTGKPRGVMISHGNIMANTNSIIQYLQLTEQDRIMTVLPFYYCFGTSLLHTHLRVGGTLVLDHRFMFPERILERMQATRCTGFAGVPSHYQVLLHKSTLRQKSLPHLRYVQQAGGYLPESAQQELQQALPNTKIFIMYGQTEATARLSYLPPEFLLSKAGSIGKGIPGTTLSVRDEQGNEVSAGQVGEIVAEGPNVALGYWREPEETVASFRHGRLYTGDRATVDEDGFIFIVGRSRDFLKCGGTRVSCKQIEQQIMQYGELLEVAVIGVADDLLGEAVKAFVVPRSSFGSVEVDLREFCRKHLPFELVPRKIVVLEELPKSESGKVLKEVLRNSETEFARSVAQYSLAGKAVSNG